MKYGKQSFSTLYMNPDKNTSLKTVHDLEPGLEANLPFLLLQPTCQNLLTGTHIYI